MSVGGTVRPVPGLRRKAVLAVLSLRAGEVVSTDQLVDIVWGDRAPATAVNTLQQHVSYVRGVLGRAAVVARGRGYLLDLTDEVTDVQRAERLVRHGQETSDRRHGAAQLRSALALWRGEALAEVGDLSWLDEQGRRLAQLRHSAIRALTDARLVLGEHAQLVPELQHLAELHPLDEDIHRQLMLALHRAGRQAEALATLERLRRTLGDDLGVEPGPALLHLEAAILRHDPALDPPAAEITLDRARADESSTGPVPRQLPSAAPHFVGRTTELAALFRIADQASGPVLITGMAGVGKTTLAVAWAHQLAPRFPDGQLYLHLRGFTPSQPALTPAEAVRGLLEGLGVPEGKFPPGFEAQVGLYRSLLSDRHVLVLLDDARDAEQVRAILPGSPTCQVIVTSRMELSGLIAVDGAYPVALDVLSDVESRQLLARRLGPGRASAEPTAVDRLIALCGGLPIAMAIVAARAATRPDFALSAIAEEAGRGLQVLHTGDPTADLWTILSWSYRALSLSAARLFRLLGLHCGPDIGMRTVASLADVDPSDVVALLAELTGTHLITEPGPGRYGFHDLLRAYAIDVANTVETQHERDAARCRYLDHYVYTAHLGARLIGSELPPIAVDRPEPGVRPEELRDDGEALRWFTAERAALLAAIEFAVTSGRDTHAWQLASLVEEYLFRRGRFDDWISAQCLAVAAARRVSEPEILPRMLHILSLAYWRAGRHDDADPPAREALDLFGDVGEVAWQARTENLLGALMGERGRCGEALAHASRALVLFGRAGDLTGQASAHNSIAMCLVRLGDHRQAIDHCQQALAHYRRSDHRIGQAATLDTLGYAHHGAREYDEALRCYRAVLRLVRDLGDRHNEAGTLTRIGDAHDAAGRHAAAREAWREAVAIYDELGHPDRAELHARLHGAVAPRP